MSRYHKAFIAGVYGLLQLVNVLAASGVSGRWVTLLIAAATAAGVLLTPNSGPPAPPPTAAGVAADVGHLAADLLELLDQRYTPPPTPAVPTPQGLTVVPVPKE